MIVLLTVLLVIVAGWLAVALRRRTVAQSSAFIPQGYTVVSADLGHDRTLGGRGAILLRDNEWGIVGKVDLLLEGPNGLFPVEYKRAGWPYRPGMPKSSHVLQLGANMLLCEGDGRFGNRPAEGWLRYLDGQGQVLPGGGVRIANTPRLRGQVIERVQRMRRALLTREELHRDHRSAAKCSKCSLRMVCDEGIS